MITIGETMGDKINTDGLPTKTEIKRMLEAQDYATLCTIFRFTPTFLSNLKGYPILDWRCVPKQMMDIMTTGGDILSTQLRRAAKPRRRKRISIEEQPVTLIHKEVPIEKNVIPPTVRIKRRTRPNERYFFYAKQNARCYYCERYTLFENMNIDHRNPLARGGDNSLANKCGSCFTCNLAKKSMTEADFLTSPQLRLIRKLK